MKIIRALALLLLFSTAMLTAQTPIETVCADLEQHALFILNHWKYSPAPAPTAMRPDFDDQAWTPIALDQNLSADSAWMRTSYIVPEHVLGEVPGGPLEIALTVDDAGILFVNGENKGRFSWDGRFTIAENATPGQKFALAVRAINTGGPMRLMRARLHFSQLRGQSEEIEGVILSLRIGEKLLSSDTYLQVGRTRRDEGIDRSSTPAKRRAELRRQLEQAIKRVDLAALKSGRFADFKISLDKSRQALVPVGKFAKEFTLVLDANAHIDCAWLWRYPETIQVARNTFTSVLDMMDARPDFTYTQSQAHLYWWMENLYPDLFARIRTRIQDKRWEVTGGMWVEPDCNLISGESWARQLLYGKRYFYEKLGVDVVTGWNPDSFGYNWNMPQFYREAGIQAFITQKIGWNDTNMFPYRLFWWEGPDGSRLLTYFPYDYTDNLANAYQMADWLRQFEANTGLKKMLILYGVGDHGGGPTLDMLDRAEFYKKLDIFPAIVYGTSQAYLDWIRGHDLGKLPVWRDELYLEYHRGTATTQSDTKKNNRENEILYSEAEQLAAVAGLYGQSYPHQEFLEGWRGVLFNQFHDILPGSSIHGVYRDAAELYAASKEIGRHNLEQSLDYLAARAATPAEGQQFIVYNPLAWKRTDLVKLDMTAAEAENMAVFDSKGEELPSQVVGVGTGDIPGQMAGSGRYQRKLIFVAKDVPATGYAVFALRKRTSGVIDKAAKVPAGGSIGSGADNGAFRGDIAGAGQGPTARPPYPASNQKIENSLYLIELDSHTGFIKRIYDKRNGREVLSGPGNELQLFKDLPTQWDAWEIALGERYAPACRGMRVVESGPVRTLLRVEHDFLKPGVIKQMPTPDNPDSYFTQDIILYEGLDRIDFATRADWWEEHVALKLAFAVNAADSAATYEIPFGAIRRPTTRRTDWEKARHEVNMQKWCDLSDPEADYGITLLNRSKYGGDIRDNVMRLTLLRSPVWPDPQADRGKHTIEYALLPHAGGWQKGGAMRKSYEYNYPLLARLMPKKEGASTVLTGMPVPGADESRLQSTGLKSRPEQPAAGALPASRSFVELDAPNVILHTIKEAEAAVSFAGSSAPAGTAAAATGGKVWILRLFEFEGKNADATIRLPRKVKMACLSDFMEKQGAALQVEGSSVRLNLAPNRIATVRVELE